MGIEASAEIARPVEVVYEYLLDIERNIPMTDSRVESVVKTNPGPPGAGAEYVMRQPVFGKVREQQVRITAAEPNRRIEMDASFGPVRPRLTFAFERTETETVTVRGDSRPVGPFGLVAPLMDRIGERNWRRRLALIEARLEGSTAS